MSVDIHDESNFIRIKRFDTAIGFVGVRETNYGRFVLFSDYKDKCLELDKLKRELEAYESNR